MQHQQLELQCRLSYEGEVMVKLGGLNRWVRSGECVDGRFVATVSLNSILGCQSIECCARARRQAGRQGGRRVPGLRDCVARCVVRDDSRASLARLWALLWPMTVGPEGVLGPEAPGCYGTSVSISGFMAWAAATNLKNYYTETNRNTLFIW